MTTNQSDSELESARECEIIVQNCLLKCLHSAEKILPSHISTAIHNKIQEHCYNRDMIAQAVQFFIFSLLNHIDSTREKLHIELNSDDYCNLQKTVQKAERDLRKHIRLQQEMKIYLTDLQNKIESLEKEIKSQKHKYNSLYQNFITSHEVKLQLQKRIIRLQTKLKHQKGSVISQKPAKVMSQASLKEDWRAYQSSIQKGDAPNRKRSLIDKVNDRSRRLSNRQSYQQVFINGSFNINLDQGKMIKKDQYQTGLKDHTKTIEFQQQTKKPIRRIVRFHTEGKETKHDKKNYRCSSVLK